MQMRKCLLAMLHERDAGYPDADLDATLILILMLIYVSELYPCAVNV